MTHSTGNRCEIYGKIDDLSKSRTLPDLIVRVQAILNELAYYAVNGEAAVMETREEWHSEFADRLYAAAAADHAAAPPMAAAAAPQRSKRAAHAGNPNGRNAAPLPPPARARPGSLPPSLQAIMNGTHASFGSNEGYEG